MTSSDPEETSTADTGQAEPDILEKDVSYSPASDTDTDRLQGDKQSSAALDDDDIDADAVKTLPGTGGPDDEGDIEFDRSELNL